MLNELPSGGVIIPLRLSSEWEKDFCVELEKTNCVGNAAMAMAEKLGGPHCLELMRLLSAIATVSWRTGLDRGCELMTNDILERLIDDVS